MLRTIRFFRTWVLRTRRLFRTWVLRTSRLFRTWMLRTSRLSMTWVLHTIDLCRRWLLCWSESLAKKTGKSSTQPSPRFWTTRRFCWFKQRTVWRKSLNAGTRGFKDRPAIVTSSSATFYDHLYPSRFPISSPIHSFVYSHCLEILFLNCSVGYE